MCGWGLLSGNKHSTTPPTYTSDTHQLRLCREAGVPGQAVSQLCPPLGGRRGAGCWETAAAAAAPPPEHTHTHTQHNNRESKSGITSCLLVALSTCLLRNMLCCQHSVTGPTTFGELLRVLTRRQVCRAGVHSAADICCSLAGPKACSRYACTCFGCVCVCVMCVGMLVWQQCCRHDGSSRLCSSRQGHNSHTMGLGHLAGVVPLPAGPIARSAQTGNAT